MARCWNQKAAERPDFKDIIIFLNSKGGGSKDKRKFGYSDNFNNSNNFSNSENSLSSQNDNEKFNKLKILIT